MKLVLQTRDLQVLKFVFACRAVTYNQITRRHFKNVSGVVARRRIKALVRAEYLRSSALQLFGKVTIVVQPLPKIWEAIGDTWPFEIENPHFKTESLEHDVRLAEVFLRFERLHCFHSFYTENLLCSSKALAAQPNYEAAVKIHSDGILSIEGSGGKLQTYAVEMELSKKTPQRYQEKLVEYYISQGLDGILYISPDPDIHRLIARIDSEVCNGSNSLLYFASEEEVKTSEPSIIFKNKNEQALEFK